MSDDDALVDAKSGRRIEHEWNTNKGLHPTAWMSQQRRLSDLLSQRCVAEAIRIGETEWDLWQRLTKAGEILDAIKYACAGPLVRRYYDLSEVPDADKPSYELQREVVWTRHDTSNVYELGYEATRYPGVDRKALAYAAAEYLERPWLRVATLDWMIVDAFITDEVINYGDSLKRTYIPGPSDAIERFHFETKTKGNVQNMIREGRKYRKHPVLTWLGYQLAFPVVTIGASIYFEAWKTMAFFIALTILDYVFVVLRLLIWGWRRMRATPEQLRTPKQNDYRRLAEMRRVHSLLEGPVINPRVLREELVASAGKGAVWDPTAWAIVDRAIIIDPAVWVTSFPAL